LRVAWLFEYPTLNGGERSLLATLAGLREEAIEPVALAPAAGPLAAQLARENVEHIRFDTFDADGQKKPRETLRQSLADHVASLRPALLHANSISMGRLAGPVARVSRLPSLAHLRDIVGLGKGAIADLNCHSRLLAVSQATREFHLRQGIESNRMQVCYNGINLELFCPRVASGWLHRRLGLAAGAVLIGNIAQVILRKGQDVLIEAAARLQARWPSLHWLVIGERHSQKCETVEYEAALHTAVRRSGLADHVHFLGMLCNIEELLPELTLLVHPARQEPLGRVLLEAAASGVPYVASDVGGTREIFPDSNHALLIPPNDSEALAASVDALLRSPDQRQQLAVAARQRMESTFDVRTAARSLAGHYRAVVAQALMA
jgi:glycosyltransferase involved in cell wall biosynthesis